MQYIIVNNKEGLGFVGTKDLPRKPLKIRGLKKGEKSEVCQIVSADKWRLKADTDCYQL